MQEFFTIFFLIVSGKNTTTYFRKNIQVKQLLAMNLMLLQLLHPSIACHFKNHLFAIFPFFEKYFQSLFTLFF